MTAPRPPEETVRVHGLPDGHASGVVCAVERRIAGAGPVRSVVPANPYACLNIVHAGQVRRPDGQPLPALFLCGPLPAPLVTVAHGPLHSTSVVFQPWRLREWFGWAPGELAGQVRAVAATNPAAALLRAFEQASPQLQSLPAAPSEAPVWAQWLEEAASVQAAAARAGCSERQFHRLFLQHFGLAPRRWLTLRQLERAIGRLAASGGTPAQVAHDGGYADQPHLTRVLRKLGGATPRELADALARGEAGPWVAKAAAVRFVQDGNAAPA